MLLRCAAQGHIIVELRLSGNAGEPRRPQPAVLGPGEAGASGKAPAGRRVSSAPEGRGADRTRLGLPRAFSGRALCFILSAHGATGS